MTVLGVLVGLAVFVPIVTLLGFASWACGDDE